MFPILSTKGWATFDAVGIHETETDLSTVKEVQIPSNANGLLVQAEDADVWLRFDGQDPDATTHFTIKSTEPAQIIALNPNSKVRVLEAVSGAVLQRQPVRVY